MANFAEIQKLLIITSPQITASDYLNLLAFIEATRLNKPATDIVINTALIEKYKPLGMIPTSDKIQIKQVVSPRKYILSFAKGESKIKNVQWTQTEKDLSMHISMENGIFKPEGMNIKVEGSDYNAIVYFNVGNFAEVSKVFEPYKNILNETKHISIGKQIGIEHQQVELVGDNRHSTLAETIYTQVKPGLNRAALNKIGAALMVETNRFKQKVKGAQIFVTFAQILEQGGDINEINSIVDKAGNAPTEKPAEPQPNSAAPRPASPAPIVNAAPMQPAANPSTAS